MLRLIHSSDWQIGRNYIGMSEAARGLLQEARTGVIRVIAQTAIEKGISIVLVAGDVYDLEEPSDMTLGKPIEIMRSFPAVTWYLMPGNHDSARNEGIWSRLRARGLPDNVILCLEPLPVLLTPTATLLPSPLPRRRSTGDLTQWMVGAETPADHIRIGMAHGPVTGFGSGDGEMTENLVPPDRAATAGLDYLALGDWHGLKKIGPKTWYSGTPETDRFKPVDGNTLTPGGHVLEVSIEAPGADPVVAPLRTGKFNWHQLQVRLMEDQDVERLAADIAALGDPASTLVRLQVEGALPLSGMAMFEQLVLDRAAVSLVQLEVDADNLLPQPTREDLEAIDTGGFVRAAAERLLAQADSGDAQKARLARLALTRLYLETTMLARAEVA